MMRSFRSRAFAAFLEDGDTSKFHAHLADRVRLRLSRLEQAVRPEEMNIPGCNFHGSRGKLVRYTIHVNGPWCITFEWDTEDAVRGSLEQYN
jgi:proteic killer suppression protein